MPQARREQAIEIIARFLCDYVGMHPVEPSDGGSNWWVFINDAEKLIDSVDAQFPPRERA